MLEDPLEALHLPQKDPARRLAAWVCPRNGLPLHFELTRAPRRLTVPRALKCPACGDDHWDPALALFGEEELATNEVRLFIGRGRDW